MKRESKRFLGLFLLSILFISVIIGCIGFVSAQDGVIKQIGDALFGGLIGSDSEGTILGITYEKILLIFLVVMLVYAVMEQLKLSDNQLINWAISVAVGILSFITIKPDTIDLILTNYTALGVVLTSVFPLMIIIFFALKLKQEHATDIFGIILPKVIYVLFTIYLLLTWYNYSGGDTLLKNVYLFTLVGILIWAVFEKTIWEWFLKDKLNQTKIVYKHKLDLQTEKLKADADAVDRATKK